MEEIKTLLPDFGRVLAIDSKAINSLARGQKRDESVTKASASDINEGHNLRLVNWQDNNRKLWITVSF